MAIQFTSATIQPDGVTVKYEFAINPPSVPDQPVDQNVKVAKFDRTPMIGRYLEEEAEIDHDKFELLQGSATATAHASVSDPNKYDKIIVDVPYRGAFYSGQVIKIIGSGSGNNWKKPLDKTLDWIEYTYTENGTTTTEKSEEFFDESSLITLTNLSTVSPASFLSATVGENPNPPQGIPGADGDYWEIKFSIADTNEIQLREDFSPRFKSIDSPRRLFIKTFNSIERAAGVLKVSGRLNRKVLNGPSGSEIVEVSIPSGYLARVEASSTENPPVFYDSTVHELSVHVHDQSVTNNSSAITVTDKPKITLRTFPDDLADPNSTHYGPTCVGLMIDPEQSDPGGGALWSRCVVKHTITTGKNQNMQSGPANMPARYTATDDPRDGYEAAVSGTTSADPYARDWRLHGKGFAHCIVATEGTYKWTMEITNEFGKTDIKTAFFDIQDRADSGARVGATALHVDSSIAGTTQTGSAQFPFGSIFDLTGKLVPPLADNDEVIIGDDHVESIGDNQQWDPETAHNVWMHRATFGAPGVGDAHEFSQAVDSEAFMFNLGQSEGLQERAVNGILIEGLRFQPTMDPSKLSNPPEDQTKLDPGIGFSNTIRSLVQRAAFVDCVIEGEIDPRTPKKIHILEGHPDWDKDHPENNFFNNKRFNAGFQFKKAKLDINGTLLLNCRTNSTKGYGISWEHGPKAHWGLVVLGGYYGPASSESCIRTTNQYGICGLTVDSVHLQDDKSKSAIRVYGGVGVAWPSVMGFVGRCQLQDGDTLIGAINSGMTGDVRIWANRLVGGNTASGTQRKLKSEWNCSECTFVSNILDLDNINNQGIGTRRRGSDFIVSRFSVNPNGNNLIAHNTLIDSVLAKAAISVGAQTDIPDGYLGNLWLNNLHSSIAARAEDYLKIESDHNIERFDGNVFAFDATAPGGDGISIVNPVAIGFDPDPILSRTIEDLNGLAFPWANANVAATITQLTLNASRFPNNGGTTIEVLATNGVHLDYYGQVVPSESPNVMAVAGAVGNTPV